VEDVILRYIHDYNEKPPVQWLRIEFDKVKIKNLLFPELQANVPEVEVETSHNDKTEIKFEDAPIFELYRPYFEDKYDKEYQIIYSQRKSKGEQEFILMLHKGLFTEGMTGRRTFHNEPQRRVE
jgi:hypothetical protein